MAGVFDPRHASGLARWVQHLAIWVGMRHTPPSKKEIIEQARRLAKKVQPVWVRAVMQRPDFWQLVDRVHNAPSGQDLLQILADHHAPKAFLAQLGAVNIARSMSARDDEEKERKAKTVTLATTPLLKAAQKQDTSQVQVVRIEISEKQSAANMLPPIEVEVEPVDSP